MRIRPANYRLSPLSKLAEVNWFIVGVMCAIACIGFAMMISAGGGGLSPFASPQITRFVFAFILMMVLALMPMRVLMDYAYVAYFACLMVLVGVDVIGHTGMGAKRWLTFGGL